MKKLRLTTREEIENEFLSLSEGGLTPFLCWIFESSILNHVWDDLWYDANQLQCTIEGYFSFGLDKELTYLTRCLTLHMMLDDNEDLLE